MFSKGLVINDGVEDTRTQQSMGGIMCIAVDSSQLPFSEVRLLPPPVQV